MSTFENVIVVKMYALRVKLSKVWCVCFQSCRFLFQLCFLRFFSIWSFVFPNETPVILKIDIFMLSSTRQKSTYQGVRLAKEAIHIFHGQDFI